MSIGPYKIYPMAIMTAGLLLGFICVNPICYAGGALTLAPADNRVVPEGTHIPAHRIQKIAKKVKARKTMMKAKDAKQQEQLPQNESPATRTPKE